MTWLPILVSATVAAVAQTAPPVTAPLPEVTLTTIVYDEGGRIVSTRSETFGRDFEMAIRIDDQCNLHRVAELPAGSALGWHVQGRIVRRESGSLVVGLDWRRGREERAGSNGTGSVELSLFPGDRVPIDRLSSALPTGRCAGVALHAGFSSQATSSRGGGFWPGGGGGGGGGGVASFGSAVGGARGGGGGAVATGSTPLQYQPDAWRRHLASDFDPSTLQEIAVELWLVHQRPDGTESAQHQVVRTVPSRGEFTFAPITLTRDDRSSSAHVFVSGVVQAQRRPDGGESLYVGLWRGVARDAAGTEFSAIGMSRRPIPMPGADEVVAFTMPGDSLPSSVAVAGTLRERIPSATAGHVFSLRVRVLR